MIHAETSEVGLRIYEKTLITVPPDRENEENDDGPFKTSQYYPAVRR